MKGKAAPRQYSKQTRSLCPICFKVIEARVFEKDGRILMEKACDEHGEFHDIYWSDAAQFKRFLKYQIPGDPIDNPNTESKGNCPFDCGICDKHQTQTILANIDVTNRCNQRCPICFANSAVAGYLYEPSLEQIKKILVTLRKQKPNPVQVVQLSGGEPTLHPNIIEIIKFAKEAGFHMTMLATNGVKIAQDFDFVKDLKESGLRAVYLQFDGMTPEPYIQARGYNALPIKMKAVENLKKVGLATVLVPTVVKGVNDSHLGDIIQYGVNNIETINAINFQPVAFTGRIHKEELERRRITIPDIMRLVEEQTGGKITKEDWMPIPSFAPMEALIEKMSGKRLSRSSVHTHCGAGVYAFEKDGSYVTLGSFVDLDQLRELIIEELERERKFLSDLRTKLSVAKKLAKSIDHEKAPKYFDWRELVKTAVVNRLIGVPNILKQKGIFVGCMHFMDPYNFDLERVERCCIHYATPDGRVIPFCAYNTVHRDAIEKKHSVRFQKTLGT